MPNLQPISVRNLLYFVLPVADNDGWRHNVHQLLKRIDQFNGKKVVAIATGDNLVPPEKVQKALGDRGFEYVLKPNDPVLREYAPFQEQLARVMPGTSAEATFYAHAKGVTRTNDPRQAEGSTYWRNLMYHALLDNPQQVATLLRRYAVVGTHRKIGRQRMPGHFPFMCDWHFAGTFFWFRNDVLSHRNWRGLPASGWALEAMPGLLFQLQEGFCLVKDRVTDPYNPDIYKGAERIPDEPLPVEIIMPGDGLKVELGGGRKPRGDGYLNVDQCDTADVRFDLEALERGARLPFEDDSVAAVYTSHCLERVKGLTGVIREILRMCKVGAVVEVRVPHWLSGMALCHGHVQTIAPPQIDHWTKSALDYWCGPVPKRLNLVNTEYVRTGNFARWKRLLPHATDDDIMELCPDACHESRWTFTVVPR